MFERNILTKLPRNMSAIRRVYKFSHAAKKLQETLFLTHKHEEKKEISMTWPSQNFLLYNGSIM